MQVGFLESDFGESLAEAMVLLLFLYLEVVMRQIVTTILLLWTQNAEEQRWLRVRLEMPPGMNLMYCGASAQGSFDEWQRQNPGWRIVEWSCVQERSERYTAWMDRAGR